MIVPDINLLVYAHNTEAPQHARARAWWVDLMTREEPVGIPWVVVLGFVRVTTHARVLRSPLSPAGSLALVRSFLLRDHVRVLEPGPRHLDVLEGNFAASGAAGSLATDAHIAALAMEHNAEVHSNDADFARFPGLRLHNPIAAR